MNASGYRVRCGGTIPSDRWGRLNASWPFIVLECDPVGVRVDVESRSARWFVSMPDREDPDEPGRRAADWSCAWSELDRVLVASRSMAFYPRRGRGCVVVGLGRYRQKPVLDMLATHSVRVESVRSTWWKRMTI